MFLNPEILWLLIVPIILVAYQLRSTPKPMASRSLITSGLRLLALSVLVAALAQPIYLRNKDVKTIVAVVDCSESMRAEDMELATNGIRSLMDTTERENFRLVVFGASAREITLEEGILQTGELARHKMTEAGSNIEVALEFAASLCPEGSGAELHLFSDGRETRGDVSASAHRIGKRGLKLVVHELGATADISPLLLGVRTHGSAGLGEQTPLSVRIESQGKNDVTIRVLDDKGVDVANRKASLRQGVQSVDVFVRPERKGWQAYHIRLDGSEQRLSAGLIVTSTVVGVVESAPGAPGADTLQSILGPNAEIRPITAESLNKEIMGELDVLVLADTPAAEISDVAQKELLVWVEQGGGLLVAGGRNAFGPGGYARSTFADALPLRFPQKKEIRDPSTALAILIDTSVSMKASGVNLAKEIARLALKRLKPHDKAGIVEFYGTKRWAAPMQSAANHIGLQRALNRLSPGGGTQLLPGLTEAYYGLVNVNARTKHILLLTDGGVERGAYGPLISRMVEDGIQLSTVTVGPRASSTFLAQLARQGRGQFYTAPNRFKLPEVIVKQPSSSLLNPFVEKPARLKSEATSRLVRDIDFDNAPALKGYVRTTPKNTAEVLLRSETGDPVLARWNYGLGRVATFTSQIGGEWGGDFLNWPATPHVMADVIRQLQGVSPREMVEIKLRTGSPGLVVDIRSLSDEPSLAMKILDVDVLDSMGEPVTRRKLTPTQGNAWQTVFETLPAGNYTVTVKSVDGDQIMGSGAVVMPGPNEFTRIAPDTEKLDAVARIASRRVGEVTEARSVTAWRELWPLCVLASILCFLLMILVRRLPHRAVAKRTSAGRKLAIVVIIGLSVLTGNLRAEDPLNLSPSEKQAIDRILRMEPDEGRNAIKEACRELTEHHGDLGTVLEYLASKKKTKTMAQLFALVALENGNLASAEGTLENLITHDPDDLWAKTQLARVYDMTGDSKGALRLLEQCLNAEMEAEPRFALLVRRVQLLYSENQIDAARKDIRKILKLPGFDQPAVRNYCARIGGLWGDSAIVDELFVPEGEGRKLMRDLLYFGQILLRRGNAEKARGVFAEAFALAKTPNDRRYVLDRLVTASREAGTLEALIQEWMEDDSLQPEQLTMMVGVLSGELNRVKDVLPILDRTDLPDKTRKTIESPEFQTRILMELLAAGYSELAHREYKELIARNPRNYFLHEGYARMLLTESRRDEAIVFLRKTVSAEQKATALMRLAKASRNLSLHNVAIESAEKAGNVDESVYFQSRMFVIEQHRLMGKEREGLDILRKLEAHSAGNSKLVGFLAEAYERHGKTEDSIRLYRSAYEKTKDEEVLKKLLAIGEISRQPDKGFGLWRELWENASEPLTVVQAQDRMLAIGADTGVLADIAIEFEEKLDEEDLSERELTMLLEIYSSANDPVSAADILIELARKNKVDILDTYRRMVRVYMECELFGRCTTILRKLIERDPDNRDDYLRSLALIALERQSKGDAAAVLAELADRNGGGILKDSFSAGVLSMIGKRKEAALTYRRALAANPDDAESWLLWANAQKGLGKTGKGQAIGRLSLLMEESGDNDLFVIALDGLLNLGAPRPVLKSALRRVYERIASQPHKRFLYRVAADLNDELRQQQQSGRILEQSLAITDEGREVVLRELMSIARLKNSEDDLVRHARSLLNTASGVPPDECLELGSVLLGKGYLSEADNAFLRITTEGDTRNMAQDIVLRYESAGYYRKAAKLIHQLVLSDPDSLDLVLRKAIIEEKLGNHETATRIYLDIFTQIISGVQRYRKGGRPPVNFANPDQLSGVVTGLILSCRTAKSRKQVLSAIRGKFRTELGELLETKALGESIGENPRLSRLHQTARRLAIIFHDRECLESIDAEVAKRYASSPRTALSLSIWRKNWGLKKLSHDLSPKDNRTTSFPDSLIPYMQDPVGFEDVFSKHSLKQTRPEDQLTFAAKFGCDDTLTKLMEKTNLGSITKLDGATLAPIGIAHGDREFQRKALFEALSPKRRRYQGLPEGTLRKQVPVVWHLLNPAEQRSAVNQFTLKVKKRTQWHNPEDYILYLKSAVGSISEGDISSLREEIGKSTGIDIATLNRYLKAQRLNSANSPYAWSAMARWWIDVPESDRPKALRQLTLGMDPGPRDCVLAQFALLLDNEHISDELLSEFKAQFSGHHVSASTAELRHMNRSVFLALSGYNDNRLTDHIRKSITENGRGEVVFRLLSGGMPDDKRAELVSQFWNVVDTYKEQAMADPRSLFYLHSFVLQPIANTFSRDELNTIVSRLGKSEDPRDRLVEFLLLRQAGRDLEALSVLNRMRSLRAEDTRTSLVHEVLPQFLVGFGWNRYALQFSGSGGDSHFNNTLLPYSLYDPVSLISSTETNPVRTSERRILVGELLQDPEKIQKACRLFLIDTRHPASGRIRHLASRISPSTGGMRGLDFRTTGRCLDMLAESKMGPREAHNWLSAHYPRAGSRTVRASLEGIMATGISKYGISDVLRDELEQAASNSMLNNEDINVVRLLARHYPDQLPESVKKEMPAIVLRDGSADLAVYCKTAGMDHIGLSLTRWGVSRDIFNKGTSQWLAQYIELLPERERKKRMQALLPLMGLNGIRQRSGGDEAMLFDTLLKLEMTSELGELLNGYLQMLRQPSFNGALQDNVAGALARVGRIEDYRRVVRRRIFMEQYRMQAKYSASPIALDAYDYTGSLPEPDQATDINTYIDIHLEVHVWLRERGVISREAQVAQLCILGKWCAEHGLKERAVELLEKAEKLAKGMLTGRLWVADLHRHLGNDTAAIAIEKELLGRELLPVARIPGVLKVMASEEGQPKADSSAFYAISYTNHPELLPLALRHAKTHGLKEDAAELGSRIEKVKRLVSP